MTWCWRRIAGSSASEGREKPGSEGSGKPGKHGRGRSEETGDRSEETELTGVDVRGMLALNAKGIHVNARLTQALERVADLEDRMELRMKVAAGMESLRQGKGVDGDEFFAQLEREEASLESKSPLA